MSELREIPVDAIDPSPDQNRETFDPIRLAELAESIRELGLAQPIAVREAPGDVAMFGDTPTRYVLVAGERRLRAVRDILGLPTITAVVSSEDDGDAALRTLAENMIRADPGPIEEARGLAAVATRHEMSVADLARRLGKSGRWVRDRLALLELADDVQHWVATGQLPVGRAVLLAGLDVNRQRLAVKAHEERISPDGFRELATRLHADQAAEPMFDADTFLQVAEIVAEAEAAVLEAAPPVVREAPLGIAEIATLLEVQARTVNQWRARGILPTPAGSLSGSPYWWTPEILAWAGETGRSVAV